MRNKKKITYRIAFCETKDMNTKFGEYDCTYSSYDAAKNAIFSKANGWGNAILLVDGDKAKVDGGWLMIEEQNPN